MTPGMFAALLAAICSVESGMNHRAINIGDGGGSSLGKCQIKYTTAKQMGYRGTISDLWLKPAVNVKWAGIYLQHLLDRYHGNVQEAVAAYNAGRVRYNQRGLIMNRKYVRKVMHRWAAIQSS